MKKVIRLMLIPMLMIFTAPAYSADPVSMFLKCGQDDEATSEQLNAVASKWLKAAKKMKGGKNIEVHLFFPIVAQMGETDLFFVLTAPSLVEWATFMEGYVGSEAQKFDKEWDELTTCADSALWKTVKISVPTPKPAPKSKKATK